MNEHRTETDPALEMMLSQLENSDAPRPFNSRERAQHLLEYFESQSPDEITTTDSSDLDDE